MMSPITIDSVEVQGFRAYLRSQTFSLRRGNRPLSFAIFAPNAKGKSSLVDAFEFYFSENGTLERLGQKAGQTQAGPKALEHVNAADLNIQSKVSFKFRKDLEQFGDTRRVSPSEDLPNSARRVLSAIKVPFVIHGYELRGFVEAPAERRYREIAGWFALDPLISIQKNLRALRSDVKAASESDSAFNERNRDVRRVTGDALAIWDESAICDWFNSDILRPLDESLSFSSISDTDGAYCALVLAKNDEQERVGVAELNRLMTAIDMLVVQKSDSESGLVPNFVESVRKFNQASRNESREREAASQSVFSDVWTNARSLFEAEDPELDSCPICDTVFTQTPHGSRDLVRLSLETKISTLRTYRVAQKALNAAIKGVTGTKTELISSLENLNLRLADVGYDSAAKPVNDYLESLKVWETDNPDPDPRSAIAALSMIRKTLASERDEIERQQGTTTYTNAYSVFNQLIRIKDDVLQISRAKSQLSRLYEALVKQSIIVESKIKEHIQLLLAKLEDDVNWLYGKMHGNSDNEPAVIQLKLATESSRNLQQLRVAVDFGPNRRSVAPTGYLSDSQIHTAALALRLAAIRTFNTETPIIILDDVVTSFDADHRKNIASMIASELGDFQIVLLTHDEQFFLLLNDHLPNADWLFRRIQRIEPDSGPVFSDHRTPDVAIDDKLARGESAGEDIRKAEEEWLLKICREFVVDVSIRPIDKPYLYDRSELAVALQRFLKDRDLLPPLVPGVKNQFLTSLAGGVVENFASHFSENPNRSASSGDDKARWRNSEYFGRCSSVPIAGKIDSNGHAAWKIQYAANARLGFNSPSC